MASSGNNRLHGVLPDDARLWHVCDSPIGPILVVASEAGVRRIEFVDDEQAHALKDMMDTSCHLVVEEAMKQLTEYFDGSRTRFSLPLDLHGTDFQKDAWLALAQIPFGRTCTYSEQAAFIGRPRAVRAIGTANSKNPIAIVLPCHRVIGADGSLTGYAGGMDKKKWLLDHESNR
jgi:methylated-DNA-[protein]-cysteine S-methyltransferase